MKVDVVVIGGGIAGVSAAAELARDGAVLLLEAEGALAYHASGRSAAMFLPMYGNDAVRALNEASADRHAAAGVLRPRPLMVLGAHDARDTFDAEIADLGVEEMDLDAARAIFPILNADHIGYAAVSERSWDLDTDLLVQSYRRDLLARGGRIETGARVDRIAREDGAWHVSWSGGAARAAHVVNAAGAWADGIARMAGTAPLGLQPLRRSMAQLTAPEGRDVTDWPFVEEAGERWYAKPDAGRWIVSPAEQDPMEPFDAWADDMVLAEGLGRYQEAVTAEVTRPLSTWAGLRTFAPDRSLVIGADPAAPDFWWLAGQGGYGFQTGPASACLLSDLVARRVPDLPASVVASVSPARFG